MTRLEALKELAAKVEARETLQAVDSVDAFPMTPDGDVEWLHACKASQGSLDAAKALHEAVLPGWVWLLDNDQAEVKPSWGTTDGWDAEIEGNPARAWLLAVLRALIAQEEQTPPKP